MSGTRTERLDRLRRMERVSVLVVGGGINGISAWRELALQGVDAILVERGDFMSGASAAPSRMIHGGLRYMENGEFALVKESLKERNRLLTNAPHMVSPLPTLIPLADRFSGMFSAARRFLGGKPKPGPRGAMIVKLGLTLYDLYSGAGKAVPRHRFFGRRALRDRWPALDSQMAFGAVYYDAKIAYPERLGVEMVLDTEAADPQAVALNHVGFDGFSDYAATLTDRLSGERFTIRPDIVVNATGAWIDITNGLIAKDPAPLIGGTKGSHLVIDNDALRNALGDNMVYFANREGRVCILFVHLGQVLAGSTDISVETPEGVRCEADEADYILASVREVFPGIRIAPEEIVFRFAGVRPLPRSNAGVNAEISRDHQCEWLPERAGEPPVLSLVGGKWTTFRAFGEQAADLVLERLGRKRIVSTQDLKIGGGTGFPRDGVERKRWVTDIAARSGLTAEGVSILLDRYGTRAAAMADDIGRQGDEPLASLPAYGRGELVWLAAYEHVETLADLVLRRTAMALRGELSLDAVEEIAGVMAAKFGWSEQRRRDEIEALLDHLEKFHGVDKDTLERRNHGKENVPVEKSPHEPAVRKRQMS
ncbi:glycerol-3-phosphate dehydrogenase/oxidase [Mesorhizobium sp. LHD-90]|uniref:glycerol-3-phosphate dehydrogenase/oxidase n=1 Tax=Mesorhizobium sp. LHD-90 TaxID=3071414 RepID=UPI0027E0ED65|nr:glycerol-3-phosphate dehydrogenase/oxidase [Mesorhizobium sp. LHD-90]MDQ6435423.1 glycerol-3-phosphate dehydrogenase/oxidase [Mesorhizobium sp. LHD-90]